MTELAFRHVLITGAASGLGREVALHLARRGDHIIIADRNPKDGRAVAQRIRENGGSAQFLPLDLGDLTAIRDFAERVNQDGHHLDVLINNAGLLPPMNRATTRDGFELAMGVAHLSHFALTSLLLPMLLRASAPRVVSVSSISHRGKHLDFDDLLLERRYSSSHAYGTSKLACLLFALELQRRATAAGSHLISLCAHPGVSSTPIATGWKSEGRRSLRARFELLGYNSMVSLARQTAAQGAQSLIHAASEPDVVPGGFYGPTGFMQMSGTPGLVKPGTNALDVLAAARLWQMSEKLTGVRYGNLAAKATLASAASAGLADWYIEE